MIIYKPKNTIVAYHILVKTKILGEFGSFIGFIVNVQTTLTMMTKTFTAL